MDQTNSNRHIYILDGPVKLIDSVKCSEIQHTASNVINLSKTVTLSGPQKALLERGLTFVPAPRGNGRGELRGDVHAFNRQLKLLDYFKDSQGTSHLPFIAKSTWTPNTADISFLTQTLIRNNLKTLTHLQSCRAHTDNLTPQQRVALRQLKCNADLVIKPADKGSAVVVMDRQQYLLEAHRQLDNTTHYIQLPHSLQSETQSQLISIFHNLQKKGYINQKQKSYLIGPNPPRSRRFYLLPKIHKDPKAWTVPFEVPQGRPIVSDCQSESYNAAQYIDYFLNPLSTLHDSYLKDTYDFIGKIKRMSFPDHAFLFTADIESLYTNIDTNLGLGAVRKIFIKYPDTQRPDEEILQLLRISLTRNDLEFNGKHYLQIHGTAMGKKFAPAYANIYMADWETSLLQQLSLKPTLYFRYLDDIFGVWPHGMEAFNHFVSLANSHHPSIKLTAQTHKETIDFLDTTVFFSPIDTGDGKRLMTKVFFKPTDTHCLLHKLSFHPKHTFRGLIKSQLIRFRRICSLDEHFEEATRVLFRALRDRGYTRRSLRHIKADTVKQMGATAPAVEPDSRMSIPLITTFNDQTKRLNRLLKKNFQQAQESDTFFQHFKIVSAYRKNPNLKDILVRAALHPDVERTPSSDTFHFRPKRVLWTGSREHIISPDITLNTKNVVYVIICTHCDQKYVGETGLTLQTRLKQHLGNIRHQALHTPLVLHFQTVDVTYLHIMGLEANLLWSIEQRRRKESYWVHELDTIFPRGFNIRTEHRDLCS